MNLCDFISLNLENEALLKEQHERELENLRRKVAEIEGFNFKNNNKEKDISPSGYRSYMYMIMFKKVFCFKRLHNDLRYT